MNNEIIGKFVEYGAVAGVVGVVVLFLSKLNRKPKTTSVSSEDAPVSQPRLFQNRGQSETRPIKPDDSWHNPVDW